MQLINILIYVAEWICNTFFLSLITLSMGKVVRLQKLLRNGWMQMAVIEFDHKNLFIE